MYRQTHSHICIYLTQSYNPVRKKTCSSVAIRTSLIRSDLSSLVIIVLPSPPVAGHGSESLLWSPGGRQARLEPEGGGGSPGGGGGQDRPQSCHGGAGQSGPEVCKTFWSI